MVDSGSSVNTLINFHILICKIKVSILEFLAYVNEESMITKEKLRRWFGSFQKCKDDLKEFLSQFWQEKIYKVGI